MHTTKERDCKRVNLERKERMAVDRLLPPIEKKAQSNTLQFDFFSMKFYNTS